MLHKGVESLGGGSFFLNTFSGDSDSDPVGEVADTLVPDELVELGINADVLSVHHLVDQLFDFFDGFGGFALELGAMGKFVDVDRSVNSNL